ncbi:MAG TPA: sigma 54-interacting transcriptional regulator [Polyangiaceae bacterium]
MPALGDIGGLVRHLSDVVLVFDVESLRVVDVNRGDEGAFGFSHEELLARDAFALFPRWWDAAKTLEPGAAVATYVKHADGTESPVDMRLARARHGDRDVILASVRTDRPLSDVDRELADVSTYLHAIVENIPDMIFVKDAATHAFRRFNRAGEELLGFTRGELLGKTDHDFYPREQADFFHAKDRDTFASRTIVDIPVEPIQTKYKGERLLHTRKIPIYDERGKPLYLLGISEDITERLKTEQQARELADVVRNLRDAVITWKPRGAIVSFNPGAERLYAITASHAIGASFERFVPDTELAVFREREGRLLAGGDPDAVEVARVRRDGRDVEVEETLFRVVDAQGQLQRIACVQRDLTELGRWRRATQVLNAVSAPQSETASGLSKNVAEALAHADLAAVDRDATVLLLGETGVGKSWVARRIHQHSPRADRPFFEINCASLAPQLVESELFGHERGAFTGASAQKRGLVETAEGGTLFLDEIGELTPSVQAQLLTFIDTRSFRRVGGNRTLSADVRLVAATNVDLRVAADQGRFRRDLYYRLSVIPVLLPPLRERREEIPLLLETLLARLARSPGPLRVTERALAAMKRYEWPGNIRELRNALERALILGRGATIDLEHLPPELGDARPSRPGTATRTTPTRGDGPSSLDEMQDAHIRRVLEEVGGNRTRAAERLGISRSTLKRKLAQMRGP